MDVGFGLVTCQQRPDDPRPPGVLYDELLELAGAAEAAALDSFWVSEHHFTEDGYLSGVMPALGAVAGVTDSLEIGTYVAQVPLHDPVRLAENAATLDLLSGGNLTLGLGLGYRPVELSAFGVSADERPAHLTDTVSLLQSAWTPGPLEYDPTFHPVEPGVTVTPKPVQSPHPPILVGAKAPAAVARAARLGDAWCAPGLMPLGGIKKRIEHIEEVREENGLDGEFEFYVSRYGFLGDSAEDAWETMREGFLYGQRKYEQWADGATTLSREKRASLREQALLGAPADIAAELERIEEALGESINFTFRGYHPGLDTGSMVECITTLGDEVVPTL